MHPWKTCSAPCRNVNINLGTRRNSSRKLCRIIILQLVYYYSSYSHPAYEIRRKKNSFDWRSCLFYSNFYSILFCWRTLWYKWSKMLSVGSCDKDNCSFTLLAYFSLNTNDELTVPYLHKIARPFVKFELHDSISCILRGLKQNVEFERLKAVTCSIRRSL